SRNRGAGKFFLDYPPDSSGRTLAEPPRVVGSGAIGCRCATRSVTVWLGAALLILISSGACRGVPVVDLGAKPPSARGTIAGIVRGPEGTSPVIGRTVEIVNIATGEKHSVTTGENGGFSIELPAGKYRLEMPLHHGH